MKIEYHHLIASVSEGDVLLQQTDFAGNEAQIVISPDQLLALADKLRGIVRPTPEVEESRKLRVLADRLRDMVTDEGFRTALIDGQRYTDWLEQIDALDDLAWEYAYGLQPDTKSNDIKKHEPQISPQPATKTDTQQLGLLNA